MMHRRTNLPVFVLHTIISYANHLEKKDVPFWYEYHLSLHPSWISNQAGNRRGRCNCRAAEIHLTRGVAVSTLEISVRGVQSDFILCEYSHVATDTGATRWWTDCCTCLDKDPQQTFVNHLQVDLLSCWNNNNPDTGRDFTSLHQFGSDPKILDATIRA